MGEDDGEAPPAEDAPAKVFSVVDIGVDAKGVGEAPSCQCIGRGESSWFAMAVGEDPLAKVFWRRRIIVYSLKVLTKLLLPKCW